jgi:hypothetical protein
MRISGAAVAVLLSLVTVGSVAEARFFGGRSRFSGFGFSRFSFVGNTGIFGDPFFENRFFNGGLNNFRFSSQFNTLNNFGFNGVNNLFFNPFALNSGAPSFPAYNSYMNSTLYGRIPANIGPTGANGGHVFNTGGFGIPINPFFGSAALGGAVVDQFGRIFGGNGFFGNGFGNGFGGFGNGFGGGGGCGVGHGGGFVGGGGCGTSQFVGFNGGGGCGVGHGGGVGGCGIGGGHPTLGSSQQGVTNEKFTKWKDLFGRAGALPVSDINALAGKWKQFEGNGVRTLHQDCAWAAGATTAPYTIFLFSNGSKSWVNIKQGHVKANDRWVSEAKAGWGLLTDTDKGSSTTNLKSGTQVWIKKSLTPLGGINLETKLAYNGKDYFCKTKEGGVVAPEFKESGGGGTPTPQPANDQLVTSGASGGGYGGSSY